MIATIEIVSVIIGSSFLIYGFILIITSFMFYYFAKKVLSEDFWVFADIGTYAVQTEYDTYLIEKSKKYGFLYILLAFAILYYCLVSENWSIFCISGLFACYGCFVFSRHMVPACILLLGLSTQDTLDFQSELNDKLFPFRSVSLLNDKNIFQKSHAMNDNFRTPDGDETLYFNYIKYMPIENLNLPSEVLSSPDLVKYFEKNDWFGAVWIFIKHLPIIVFDLRNIPEPEDIQLGEEKNLEHIKKEFELINKCNYLFKAFFILDKSSLPTILQPYFYQTMPINDDKIVYISNEKDCINILRKLLKENKVAPTRERPIWEIINTIGKDEIKLFEKK